MPSESRGSDFISLARQYNKAIWENLHLLQSLQAEWNALEYGTNLPDGSGSNAGITRNEVGAVVFAGADALIAVLNGGVATSMGKLL